MGTKVYFFAGPQYFRYDRVDDKVDDGYPLPIAGNWSGLAEDGFADRIDAAINWGDGKLFLFRGDRYVRYDIAMDQADGGYPLPIAGYWSGFQEAGFASGVDAAVNWGNGKAYFFQGGQYLRYDIKKDKVDSGYPLPIAGNWPGIAEAGFTAIDAVGNWGDGTVYFFRGNQYLRYDIQKDKTDDGYPLPITGNWSGLAVNATTGPLGGAVDLFVPTNREVWLEGAEIIRSPHKTDRTFCPFPGAACCIPPKATRLRTPSPRSAVTTTTFRTSPSTRTAAALSSTFR
jgi:Hemopexin